MYSLGITSSESARRSAAEACLARMLAHMLADMLAERGQRPSSSRRQEACRGAASAVRASASAVVRTSRSTYAAAAAVSKASRPLRRGASVRVTRLIHRALTQTNPSMPPASSG